MGNRTHAGMSAILTVSARDMEEDAGGELSVSSYHSTFLLTCYVLFCS